MAQRKVGDVPPNKIAVVDYKGRLRGHLGLQATSVSAQKFGIRPGAQLTPDGWLGKPAWVETAPEPQTRHVSDKPFPPAQPETKDHAAARGSVKRSN